jgi:hypothetical protein
VRIVDRVHDRISGEGTLVFNVSDLDNAEEIRLTVEARRTALRAAVALAAEGKVRSDAHGVMELAGRFEAWLLRE